MNPRFDLMREGATANMEEWRVLAEKITGLSAETLSECGILMNGGESSSITPEVRISVTEPEPCTSSEALPAEADSNTLVEQPDKELEEEDDGEQGTEI